jgi:hypothetical protein
MAVNLKEDLSFIDISVASYVLPLPFRSTLTAQLRTFLL